MNDAAKLNMALEILPEVVASVSSNLQAVDSINIYGGEGSSKILGMSQESLKQGLDVLGTMGIDVPDLLNNFSSRGNSNETLEKVEKNRRIKKQLLELFFLHILVKKRLNKSLLELLFRIFL